MNNQAQSNQNRWLASDLDEEDRTTTQLALTDETRIVRYVRLSTLFHYLSGRAFIPSLRLLRNLDRQEGLLASEVFFPAYENHLENLLMPAKDWLAERGLGPKVPFKPIREKMVALRYLADVWLDELARRRSVWCWNIYEGDSNALWTLYGQRGVAIHSTIGAVKGALGKVSPFRCLIAPVRYPIARRMFYQGENPGPTAKMIHGKNLFRPYIFKDRSYRYEEEVRFVFGTHPGLVKEEGTFVKSKKGILIEIDARVLVHGISLSPDIPADEAELIADLFEHIQKGQRPAPPYPTGQGEEWTKRLAAVGGTPFTMEDAPDGLFPDLDS